MTVEAHWVMVWHQALTRSLRDGRAFGWNRTAVFELVLPVSGTQVRLRLCNRRGSEPYRIGAVRVLSGGRSVPVTMDGRGSFEIPVGSVCHTDPCVLTVRRGDTLEVRLYYTNAILDSNMIEEGARLAYGDRTIDPAAISSRRPFSKTGGIANPIPAIEAIEVLAEEPSQAIVAFGDSITALGSWTKPLARRLRDAYGGRYALLNSGISGNCLLYEPHGPDASAFGERGIDRFGHDVLDIPSLHAAIIGLGINDVSYLSDETVSVINYDAYVHAVRTMTDALHERDVRVVMQTMTPRLGCSPAMGVFTQEMEALRLGLNEWIRSAGIFDDVFDAEAVVRVERADGLHFREDLHVGDRLHPNAQGGRLLADAVDMAKLTGDSG